MLGILQMNLIMYSGNRAPGSHEILMFVCEKMPDNAGMPQGSVVLIELVNNWHNEDDRAL